jgi:hypothetical protein
LGVVRWVSGGLEERTEGSACVREDETGVHKCSGKRTCIRVRARACADSVRVLQRWMEQQRRGKKVLCPRVCVCSGQTCAVPQQTMHRPTPFHAHPHAAAPNCVTDARQPRLLLESNDHSPRQRRRQQTRLRRPRRRWLHQPLQPRGLAWLQCGVVVGRAGSEQNQPARERSGVGGESA